MITDKLYYSIKKNIRKGYPNLSEDQVAEALHFGIIEAEKKYDSKKNQSFGSWVWMIVKYRLIDELRRTGLHDRKGNERLGRHINAVGLIDNEDIAEYDKFYERFAINIDPSENMIAEETMEMILRQYRGKKYRKVIELKMEDYTTKDIAEEMKVPTGTVNSYLYQIRIAMEGNGFLSLRHYRDPKDTIRYAVHRKDNIKKTLQKRWTEQREMNRV